MAMSTLSSNFAYAVFLTMPAASSTVWRFSRSYVVSACFRFLATFGMVKLALVREQSYGAGRMLGAPGLMLGAPGIPVTSTPIERAVPAMLRAAASSSLAFMSGIFSFAISLTCSQVSLPTFCLLGSLEPEPGFLADDRPHAFLMS